MSQGNEIYQAINNVMADIGSIQKNDLNNYDKYKYRGIDAVYNAVQPALIKNGVFIVPQLQTIEQTDRLSRKQETQIHTRVTVQFTLFAKDGSSITCVFPGEAVDRSDKSINKAMTAAFKYMIFELFCIPTEDLNDADAESNDIGTVAKKKEPDYSKQLANNIERKTFQDTCKALGVEPTDILRQAGWKDGTKMTVEDHGKAMIILKEIEDSQNG